MTNKCTEKAHTIIYCTYCGTAAEKLKKKAGYSEENGKPLFAVVDVCPNYKAFDDKSLVEHEADKGNPFPPRIPFPYNPHLNRNLLYQFEEEEIKDIEFAEVG